MFLTIVHIILCGSQDEKIKPLMLFEDFETKTFLLKQAKIEATEIFWLRIILKNYKKIIESHPKSHNDVPSFNIFAKSLVKFHEF